MISIVLFTLLFISQNVLVDASVEQIIVGDVPNQDTEPPPAGPELPDPIMDRMATKFPKGIVPYFIETASYDSIIVSRIQNAMDVIEASSCLVFKQTQFKPVDVSNGSWVHFTNPEEVRDCVHEPGFGPNREIIIILGYECMMLRNILHAVLHAIGFKDEVSHPHRDQYIKIMWENIQPRYRDLFRMQKEDVPYKTVEYDPMSIMHFHDRAFSINGGLTIAPRMPGLLINPSEKLSQLDVMKLRLWFGHECNKRKVGALLEKCKTVFHNSPSVIAQSNEVPNESVEADDTNQYEVPYERPPKIDGDPVSFKENGGEMYNDNEYDADAGKLNAGNYGGNESFVVDKGDGKVVGEDDDGGNGNNGADTGSNGNDGGDNGSNGNDGGDNGSNGNNGGDNGINGNDGGDNGGNGNNGGDAAEVVETNHDQNNDDGANEIPNEGTRRKVKIN